MRRRCATAEAIRALKLQNDSTQASQLEMAKQLREVSETLRSTRSFDWNPVSVELTEGAPRGSPQWARR